MLVFFTSQSWKSFDSRHVKNGRKTKNKQTNKNGNGKKNCDKKCAPDSRSHCVLASCARRGAGSERVQRGGGREWRDRPDATERAHFRRPFTHGPAAAPPETDGGATAVPVQKKKFNKISYMKNGTFEMKYKNNSNSRRKNHLIT